MISKDFFKLYLKKKFKENECSWLLYEHFLFKLLHYWF